MRVAVIGSTGGWHAERLERALSARGHECAFAPVTRMVGRIEGGFAVRSREVALDACDVVIVRAIPRGSLEQIVFRVDTLHALAAVGVRAVNGALAIEHTIDKFLASALLAAAGVPTPRTVACERADDALEAFDELGSDVIVKPLFGSMGFGMARVEDRDVAQRVFRSLEIGRAVYYLQETLPHDGVDVRALVVGDRVVGAIERVGDGLAGEPRARRERPADQRWTRSARALCVQAAATLGTDYAGVDLLRAADGRDYVIEVNGIPGWRGVESATGVDVAAALVEHLERSVARRLRWRRRAARWRPAPRTRRRRPARAGRPASRTPPPASSSTSGKRACSSPSSVTSGPSPEPTRARSSTIASRAPASAKRASASAAAMPLSAGSGESSRPARRSRLSTSGASGSSARSRRNASAPRQRLGADHDARDAQLEQPRDRRRPSRSRRPPSPAPPRASAATTSGLPGPPAIASRSAT